MYRIWIIHYAFVKGVYRKRRELTNSSASALTTFCTVSLLLFIIALVIDKEMLWGAMEKNLPFGPLVKWIALIGFVLLTPLFKSKLTAKKIKFIRNINLVVRNTNRLVFISYVMVYMILFILAIVIPILFRMKT